MPSASFRELFAIAEDQMGHVTTAQAHGVGISPMTLVMMERRGTLERVSRAVYRLVEFPTHPLAQYMQASLWPTGHDGVLSHETALSLHELADVDPPKVHITIPATVRLQRTIPRYLVVHRESLEPNEIMRWEGLRITTPQRTIRDGIRAHLGPAIITQAIESARRSGAVDAQTTAQLEQELHERGGGPTSGAHR